MKAAALEYRGRVTTGTQESGLLRGYAVLKLRSWHVLFADCGAKSKLDQAT